MIFSISTVLTLKAGGRWSTGVYNSAGDRELLTRAVRSSSRVGRWPLSNVEASLSYVEILGRA